MPFTLSHPAAVVPLRPLLRWSVFSALAIGSMAPDFIYFVGAARARWHTHTFAAVAWFSLPVGLACYLAFQRWLRTPWIHLLPAALAARIPLAPPRASLAAVIASLALGAISHVLWDSFTHEHQPGVILVRGLNAVLVELLGFPVRGYNLLQHGSTLVGALVLVSATLDWQRRTPPGPLPPRWASLRRLRARLPGLLVLGVGPGCLAFARVTNPPRWEVVSDVQVFVGAAVVSAMTINLLLLLAYAAWWHWPSPPTRFPVEAAAHAESEVMSRGGEQRAL